MTLMELNRIASWKLPVLLPSWKANRGRPLFTLILASIVLLSLWPAQLASLLASGSTTWLPTYRLNSTSVYSYFSTAFADPTGLWAWFHMYPSVRLAVVQNAAARASITDGYSNHWGNGTFPVPGSARRVVPQFSIHPAGSAVQNVTVPVFDVSSIKWLSAEDITEDMFNVINNDEYLSITGSGNPLRQTTSGTAALLTVPQWSSSSLSPSALPEPYSFTGTQYAVILVSRYWNHGDPDNYPCQSVSTTDFDPLPPGLDYLINRPFNNYSDCFAAAAIEVSYGVGTCTSDAKNISNYPLLAEHANDACLLSPGSSGIVTTRNYGTLQADSLVGEVLAMMPEVQALKTAITVTGMNTNTTKSGNLEGYLLDSLISSYQGAWSALSDALASPTLQSTVMWDAYQVQQAQVAQWRIWVYLGLNLLLPISGLVLMALQVGCIGKTVESQVITNLMLDTSDITNHIDGLCNSVDVSKEVTKDPSTRQDLRLRLRVWSANEEHEKYHHPMLVRETNPGARVHEDDDSETALTAFAAGSTISSLYEGRGL